MLKILGKPTSINVRKVLWTCAEIGQPYEHEPHGDGHLALNPNGLVPVIVDEGQALWESNTICRYLAGKHGRTDLLPAEPMARAQVEKWMDWQATELNTAWRYAFMGLVRGSPAYADAKAIAASAAEWNRLMTLLDARLAATGAYVAGDQFSLADIVLGLSHNRWLSTPIEHPTLPAMQAWAARLATRAGYLTHAANGVP
ncbi:glutathione S-transferase family protein [Duganella radicis]|uniref:Glutathione S-transferase n=1 Tax=Duganella radicis TaxID=551988 RepID=A0A6L6PHA0_9BURK|nr:glutathione S-transferase N-terminal domain-containing protein [Duganella radicis]MTV38448.1 glutathione S-transferase [Duganella radicis]